MKLFYGIIIVDTKTLRNFFKQLPSASRYALQR